MKPLEIPSCDECEEIAELKAQIADLEERLGTHRPGVPIGEALFAIVGGGPLKWANMPEHKKGEWTRASGRLHSLGYESGMRKSRERIDELERERDDLLAKNKAKDDRIAAKDKRIGELVAQLEESNDVISDAHEILDKAGVQPTEYGKRLPLPPRTLDLANTAAELIARKQAKDEQIAELETQLAKLSDPDGVSADAGWILHMVNAISRGEVKTAVSEPVSDGYCGIVISALEEEQHTPIGIGRPANGSPIQRINEILDEHCDGDGRSLEARVTELIVDLRNTRSFASGREFAGYRNGVRDTLRGMYGGGE